MVLPISIFDGSTVRIVIRRFYHNTKSVHLPEIMSPTRKNNVNKIPMSLQNLFPY
jgi:hypothetical protein